MAGARGGSSQRVVAGLTGAELARVAVEVEDDRPVEQTGFSRLVVNGPNRLSAIGRFVGDLGDRAPQHHLPVGKQHANDPCTDDEVLLVRPDPVPER